MNFDTKKYLLNNDDMDNLHKEFIDIYNNIEDDTIQSYNNIMIQLLEQTKKHFSSEENMMDKFKYPRSKQHKDEHNKVLSEMEYFVNMANTKMGQMMLKSYYKEKIPSWFDFHLISMDSDLSAYIESVKKNL